MARTLSYQYDHDRLIAKYGWDAIWADNTEPQGSPDGVNVHAAATALGKGAFHINAYPLEHDRGIYYAAQIPAGLSFAISGMPY